MVFYKSSYPKSMRVWMKMVPAAFLLLLAGSVPVLAAHMKAYRLHQRHEKFVYKSNPFERFMRERASLFENQVLAELYEQP